MNVKWSEESRGEEGARGSGRREGVKKTGDYWTRGGGCEGQ